MFLVVFATLILSWYFLGTRKGKPIPSTFTPENRNRMKYIEENLQKLGHQNNVPLIKIAAVRSNCIQIVFSWTMI